MFYAPDVSLYAEKGSYVPSRAPVFYNPKMALSRDVAVCVLQAYSKEASRRLRVCIPMAGCGVRALRFMLETDGVESIVVNDLNPAAVSLIEKNFELHGLKGKATICCDDANTLLSSSASRGDRFDLVDLDPFGSPAPFLESTIRALKPKGAMLCVTATDLPLLCGSQPKACLRRYGSMPLKGEYCHEVAVRILIAHAVSVAAKYDYALQPMLSYYFGHHVRVYFKGKLGAKSADEKLGTIGYLAHCDRCLSRKLVNGFPVSELARKCPSCGGEVKIAGPLWCGPLQDEVFLRETVKIAEEKEGGRTLTFLRLLLMEASAPPLYYNVHRICSAACVPCPPIKKVIESLRERGFSAFKTHFSPISVKTDAPPGELLTLLKELSSSSKF
ncbi:MAG: tRNA (guanine(10)-N(2))-dimethyltransferase [Candidatus Freyarchaeota archaeon]|nr:tRNA (guanine(10)-N(2))-dimethyltransferase [Candidatus Jordarchaeia archaeon]